MPRSLGFPTQVTRPRLGRSPMAILLAVGFALAGFLGLPVWAFAVLSVATAFWRAPGTRRDHPAAA